MILPEDFSEKWLAPQSSPVDWCEENYTVSSNIAEFTNTLSNVLIVLIPAYCIRRKLWQSYCEQVSYGPKCVLYMTILVGLASVYFHGTLSLLGQLLDEVWIIWALCISYASFTSDQYRPAVYRGKASYFISMFLATLLTLCWFVAPITNSFWLMAMNLPVLYFQVVESFFIKRSSSLWLTRVSLATSVLAMACWFMDRAMCGFWLGLGVPGLHNMWHLLSGVAAYLNLTVFAYLKVVMDNPGVLATIRYSPGGTWGLPYIQCRGKSPL